MIDLHSHILRGIDDGAHSLDDSLEIACAAVADGITVIAGTLHVRDDWPTDAGVMGCAPRESRPWPPTRSGTPRCRPARSCSPAWSTAAHSSRSQGDVMNPSRSFLPPLPVAALLAAVGVAGSEARTAKAKGDNQ
jgi:Capsular polysaccharide synthesis, CpsB/CapC